MGHEPPQTGRQPRTYEPGSLDGVTRLAKRLARSAVGRLGVLASQRMLREIRAHGMSPQSMRALEVFGFTGERMTRFYASRVASLDVWEIEDWLEPVLRRNLPDATVTITDSFAEMRRTDGVWDLVVIDNPVWPGEHFDLFPAVYRALSDRAVIAVRVLPEVLPITYRRYPGILDDEHRRRRAEFYRVNRPEAIPLSHQIATYVRMAEESGLVERWHRTIPLSEPDGIVPRRSGFHLLLLGFDRPHRADGEPAASQG